MNTHTPIEEDSADRVHRTNPCVKPLMPNYECNGRPDAHGNESLCFWLNNADFMHGPGIIQEHTAYIHWLLGGNPAMYNRINTIVAAELSGACPFAAARANEVSGAQFKNYCAIRLKQRYIADLWEQCEENPIELLQSIAPGLQRDILQRMPRGKTPDEYQYYKDAAGHIVALYRNRPEMIPTHVQHNPHRLIAYFRGGVRNLYDTVGMPHVPEVWRTSSAFEFIKRHIIEIIFRRWYKNKPERCLEPEDGFMVAAEAIENQYSGHYFTRAEYAGMLYTIACRYLRGDWRKHKPLIHDFLPEDSPLAPSPEMLRAIEAASVIPSGEFESAHDVHVIFAWAKLTDMQEFVFVHRETIGMKNRTNSNEHKLPFKHIAEEWNAAHPGAVRKMTENAATLHYVRAHKKLKAAGAFVMKKFPPPRENNEKTWNFETTI